MKRLFFLLALVVGLQLNVSAQLKFEVILPDTLVGKKMLENAIKQAFKDYGKPTGPVVVKPEKVKCSDIGQGPDIKAISSVTGTGLDLLFHGNGIDTILVDIFGPAGQLIRSQAIRPTSSTVPIPFGQLLPAGNYQLRLQGQSCKSDPQTQPFTIPNRETGGGTNPAPDPGTPAPVGLLPLINLTQGMDEHLKLSVRDSADVRIVNDLADDSRGDKGRYLYRYLINAQQIDTDKRLKNYIVAGNNPLRVLVGKLDRQYKIDGFNRWGTGRPEEYAEGWFKIDAGEAFSYNTSYAFQTFITRGAQAATGFLNHIPQSYDPSSQQVSWGEIGEDIQLPKGHFWGASWYPWGVDKVFAKGVTHLAHHSLPWNDADGNKLVKELKAAGKTFSNFQRIEAVFGRSNNGSPETWPNGTSKAVWPTADGLPTDEARQWAWKTDASDAIWLSEMSENVGWQPNWSPMFSAFYPELRKRYEQNFGSKGIPYEIIHNYFWQGGESLKLNYSAEFYKQLFRKSPQDMPVTEFSPGNPLSSTTMIVEAVYLNAPDQVLTQPTELAWRLEYFKQMGYHAGVALFGVHETRPNNRYKINFPDGTYYKADKAPLDPNVHIASLFFGHVYGNATFEWGAQGWANQKLFDGRPGQPLEGDWFPLGSKEPRNNEFNKLWNGSGDFYHGFTGSADLTYFAHRLYAKTWGQTEGGTRAYLPFRIDGGAWITPAQYKADELVDAYKQQRGFVYSQTLAGKTGWFYHNSFADNLWHTLEVKLPSGQVITERVAGNGIHAKIQ